MHNERFCRFKRVVDFCAYLRHLKVRIFYLFKTRLKGFSLIQYKYIFISHVWKLINLFPI